MTNENTAQRIPRAAIIDAMGELLARGLNHGTTGNVSVRTDTGLLITPSGVPVDQLRAEQIVSLFADGSYPDDGWRPSSEWRLHTAIYQARADVHAVVHTHSPHATALACLRRDIPALHYIVALAGGPSIRCASYATFGSEELGDRVVSALEQRRACLLANHGMVAVGENLEAAIELAGEVEQLAHLYGLALSMGKPVILDDTEMTRVLGLFSTYGQH
jgi:L-fuculose-phosphate aldolase